MVATLDKLWHESTASVEREMDALYREVSMNVETERQQKEHYMQICSRLRTERDAAKNEAAIMRAGNEALHKQNVEMSGMLHGARIDVDRLSGIITEQETQMRRIESENAKLRRLHRSTVTAGRAITGQVVDQMMGTVTEDPVKEMEQRMNGVKHEAHEQRLLRRESDRRLENATRELASVSPAHSLELCSLLNVFVCR